MRLLRSSLRAGASPWARALILYRIHVSSLRAGLPIDLTDMIRARVYPALNVFQFPPPARTDKMIPLVTRKGDHSRILLLGSRLHEANAFLEPDIFVPIECS